MSFKFAEIEGFDPELAATLDADATVLSAIDSHITESASNRVEVAKGEFKKKQNALNEKLQAAEEKLAGMPDVDADELKAMKEAMEKNPELQSTLKAMREQAEKTTAEHTAERDQLKAEIKAMRLTQTVNQSIQEYNTAFPTFTIKPDMHDVVSMLANSSLRYDEDTQAFRVYENDDIVVTDKGAASPVDWLKMLRDKRPSLFNAPAGGGAPGSKNPGSAKKYAEMSEAEKTTLFRENPAEFQRQKALANGDNATQ